MPRRWRLANRTSAQCRADERLPATTNDATASFIVALPGQLRFLETLAEAREKTDWQANEGKRILDTLGANTKAFALRHASLSWPL